jgi:PAS domain S-box-containing protein
LGRTSKSAYDCRILGQVVSGPDFGERFLAEQETSSSARDREAAPEQIGRALAAGVALSAGVILASRLPAASLAAGLLLAWLLAVSVYLLGRARAQRRRLDAELAGRTIAEERYRILFERNPAGVYRSTVDGRLLDCNEAFIRMFGYDSREEMLALRVSSLYYDPADRERLLLQFLENSSPQNVEVRLKRRNGEVFWGLLRGPGGSVDRTPDGATVIEGAILDITDRKRAEESLRESERELMLLAELGGLLQTCDTLEEARLVTSRQGRKLFPGLEGAVYLISPSRSDLDLAAGWGGGEAPREELFRPEDCWALRTGREHFFTDPAADLLCRHLDNPAPGSAPAASFCVPLVALGETLGVLHLRESTNGHGGILTKGRRQLAATAAEQLAMAIANLKLRETLRHQSIRDSLTGLYNRRYFQEALDREIRRVRRHGRSLGLIMIDIDGFKGFNDTHGHEAGDVLLRAFGELLLRRVRGEDFACRYGGEEFALILPEAPWRPPARGRRCCAKRSRSCGRSSRTAR